jgi:hypothetical protein
VTRGGDQRFGADWESRPELAEWRRGLVDSPVPALA